MRRVEIVPVRPKELSLTQTRHKGLDRAYWFQLAHSTYWGFTVAQFAFFLLKADSREMVKLDPL